MNRVLLLVCLIIGVGFIIFAVNAVNDASNTPEAGRPVQGDAGELLDWAKSQSWGKKESVSVNGGTLVIEITGYNTLYDLIALAGGRVLDIVKSYAPSASCASQSVPLRQGRWRKADWL